ncbi:MAG: hypothetical protein U1C70_07790 [Sediminibacterium sp.]|uniref:hypothetical protein n=1 Tax=Sediminibacterium sp. TaxID=1917865 RepID=UPI002ABCD4F1|nr:hypothetical protein [Sediminibacterium sp.]MDZ4071710.1 hypothetical protein [Sediminibacterium sp.]
MELDELKYQLNQRLATDHASRSNADISALLKKKTHSVISKIKRSLIIEMVLCVLFFVAMLYVCFITNYWSIRVYFGVFTVLTVLMTLVLYYLYRRTDTLSDSDRPIKANLQTLVGLLEEFVKRYFQFTMALLPVCFMFSMILSYADPVEIPEIEKFSVKVFTARWQVMVFLGVYMIALAISVYYFTKWYLKKLYGNYLTELKQYIAELDQ